MQSNIVGPNVRRVSSIVPSTAGGGKGEVAGRAGEDAMRVSAGDRMPEAGLGSSVHADSGLGDGSFATAIHSDSSSSSCSYSFSCE